MLNNIKNLEKKLKIKIKDKKLFKQALTHKSFDSNNNYEKLEFFGDRVLGLVISKKLINLFPNEKVGMLDKKLASLVNKDKCYDVGIKLNLDKYVKVGNLKHSSKIEKKIISDCCESLIGYVYLDLGFKIVEKFILEIWDEFIKKSDITIIDAKTKLQEYSLKHFKALPVYKVFSNTGPRHKPEFKVGVKLKNTNFIISNGSSKKIAEQAAASRLLKKLF
tara:strand:- start:608 stop:1267 length:660 start_codon:yes stop_codon:yes gene_type:complete